MRIINTFDQLMAARKAGLPDVAVVTDTWRGSTGGVRIACGAAIWKPGVNLAPRTEWGRDGMLVFSDSSFKGSTRERRKQAFAAAKKRAAEKFGVESWFRNSMGDHIDRRVAKQFPIRKD